MTSIPSQLSVQPLPFADSAKFNAHGPKNSRSPERVASEFESVFTSIMLKEMRKTLEPGSMFGEDSSDIYGGMFDRFLGQHMADSGGIGLAKMIREAVEKSNRLEQSSSGVSPADVPDVSGIKS